MSRRKKGIVVTSVLVGGLLVVTTVLLVLPRLKSEVYLPGQPIDGVTSRLDRQMPEDAPVVLFRDVAAEAGIVFEHFQATRTSRLPEDMGSGVSWADYDNDGWQDLYLVNISGPATWTVEEIQSSQARNALYQNSRDGSFKNVSAEAGVELRCMCSGAAWGDYDNDGWIDLFVTSYGENRLFRNRGDGRFEDVTDASGVGGRVGFWAGASWADFDRDGLLDLYVTGYVKYVEGLQGQSALQYDVEQPASINPSSFAPESNLLYRNRGDGTFTEMARSAGVDNPNGRSLSAAWADFDDDGWPDLYVANDVSDNVLYRNRQDGTFEDVSHLALVADYRGAMGLAVGDWDGDLDLDLFVTHWIAQENALYSNRIREPGRAEGDRSGQRTQNRPLRFIDVADRYGLGQVALDYVGWGTFFFDYDNDGREDLFVSNGSTFQMPDRPADLIPMRNMLFWNGGEERGFFDASTTAGSVLEIARVSRGAAFADYDNDGDLDVAVSVHSGRALLLRNEGGGSHHWLGVRLVGSPSNRDGIGARIRVVAGSTVAIREVGSQPSYMSQSTGVAHFGLGSRTRVDTLEVGWPSGANTLSIDVASDQIITIHETD